uniref:Tubulin--tyrosine ligase-like protein 9 n=1 Tax=Macrostomum lignano TaxID=282301 RepID=A0A1I8GI76_9PLAT
MTGPHEEDSGGLVMRPANSDAILPTPPPPLPQSKLTTAGDKAMEEADGRKVLTSPYLAEACCSRLLNQFSGRLGLFVAGRPRNYAFRANRNALFASDKWNMARILSRKAGQSGLKFFDASGAEFNYRRFTMYTANPGLGGRQQLIRHLGVYVLKRTNSSQGIGIHMYRAQQPNSIDLLQRCIGQKARLQRYVLQKYIERPLLVDKRKFDLRVYLLVLSCSCPGRPGDRGYFAFCHPGYVKVSSRAYAGDSRDPRVHFTNQWVQRRGGRQYECVKEATTWLPDELDAYLERRRRNGNGPAVPEGWCRQKLYRQVAAIAGYLAWSCRPYLASRRPGCVFRIYGPDLIVDEDLRVSLLEFNCFPCYAKNTMALSTSLGSMWREAVAIATEASLRYRDGLPVAAPTTARNFCQVFSSQNPAVLGKLISSCFP